MYGSSIFADTMGAFDSDVGTLRGIFNDATLQEIGGSLGVAISDGDRQFVANIGPAMGKTTEANREGVSLLRQAMIRKRDYNSNRIYALSEGQMALPEYDKLWRKFAEANPLVKRDKRGKIIYERNPVKFEDWINNAPKFDAQGNRVK